MTGPLKVSVLTATSPALARIENGIVKYKAALDEYLPYSTADDRWATKYRLDQAMAELQMLALDLEEETS